MDPNYVQSTGTVPSMSELTSGNFTGWVTTGIGDSREHPRSCGTMARYWAEKFHSLRPARNNKGLIRSNLRRSVPADNCHVHVLQMPKLPLIHKRFTRYCFFHFETDWRQLVAVIGSTCLLSVSLVCVFFFFFPPEQHMLAIYRQGTFPLPFITTQQQGQWMPLTNVGLYPPFTRFTFAPTPLALLLHTYAPAHWAPALHSAACTLFFFPTANSILQVWMAWHCIL